MLPGGPRDTWVAVAKVAFPVAALILGVLLVILPLTMSQEFSFLLSKDSAMKAGERMRVAEATYRGETERGEAFRIRAESGVQKTSAVPVVVLSGLSAEIDRADGLARVTAPSGEFFINENRVVVNGPVAIRSQGGFTLDGDRIEVDIDAGMVRSTEPVSGRLPMGAFRSNGFEADLEGRTVVMDGGVRLRIVQQR